MYADRIALYRELEALRATRVITLVTGDRPGLETEIHPELVDCFVHHLRCVGPAPRLTLILHTCGGDMLVAWSILRLLREYCDELEVIVPARALSSGTLICLGADTIVMTRAAMLGPIDPSVFRALNPRSDPTREPVAVSVEEVHAYVDFLRQTVGDRADGMRAAMSHLPGQVHPLVLGSAYRSRMQIRRLARRLLGRQIEDETRREQAVEYLCGGAGSHDYSISRSEARDELGLRVAAPGDIDESVIRALHEDISGELQLRRPYRPNCELGEADSIAYCLRRGLLESVAGGCHVNVKNGMLRRVSSRMQPGSKFLVQDDLLFEEWQHVV